MMHITTNRAADAPAVVFPAQRDTHWVTERRVAWNEQERVAEERELIYEVSWIPELAVSRRFLRSQRKVQS